MSSWSLVDDTVVLHYGIMNGGFDTLWSKIAAGLFLWCFLFLRNWRATLIAAVAPGAVAIPTFMSWTCCSAQFS